MPTQCCLDQQVPVEIVQGQLGQAALIKWSPLAQMAPPAATKLKSKKKNAQALNVPPPVTIKIETIGRLPWLLDVARLGCVSLFVSAKDGTKR
jgi:hypothetical protein